MDVKNILKCQLGLVDAELLGRLDPQLGEGGLHLLQDPRVDLVHLTAALLLDRLQEPYGYCVLVDASARVHRGDYDLGLGHHVHADQIVHCFADLPAIDLLTAKVRYIPENYQLPSFSTLLKAIQILVQLYIVDAIKKTASKIIHIIFCKLNTTLLP